MARPRDEQSLLVFSDSTKRVGDHFTGSSSALRAKSGILTANIALTDDASR